MKEVKINDVTKEGMVISKCIKEEEKKEKGKEGRKDGWNKSGRKYKETQSKNKHQYTCWPLRRK